MQAQTPLIGEISAHGIRINCNRSILTGCCVPRHILINYKDILKIEKDGPNTLRATYLDKSGRPFTLRESLIQINSANTDTDELWMGATISDAQQPIEGFIEYIKSRSFSDQDLMAKAATKPLLVLVNPFSGSGKAYRQYMEKAHHIFEAANIKIEVIKTKFAGDARQTVQTVNISDYSAIICVSGDGLIHEVLNGLCDRKDAVDVLQEIGIAQLPGGSGNALTLSLNEGEKDWGAVAVGILKGYAQPIDIMAISQENGVYYSFLSQAYGVVAGCDLGTESLRWMGSTRFALGIVYRCLSKHKYPCEIAYKEEKDKGGKPAPQLVKPTTIEPEFKIDDQIPEDWTVETHKNLSMFWVGKLPWMSSDAKVFPKAEFTDGCMDMLIWGTDFGHVNSLDSLIKLETGKHVEKAPFYKKISSYRVTPLTNEPYLSIDGEAYPPTPFHVSVIPQGAKFIVPSV